MTRVAVTAAGVDAAFVESREFEETWLPRIGPSSLLMFRKLVRAAREEGAIDLDELMTSLGLTGSKHGPGMKTLARLERFRFLSTGALGFEMHDRRVQCSST